MAEARSGPDGPARVPDLGELLVRARAARRRAYAPYSRFLVGAAVAIGDGRIFEGCNVENASYGLSICAERVAATAAVAAGARRIEAIAVTSSAEGAASPCGACRQFLHEFNPDMRVVCEGSGGARAEWMLSELLPHGFGPSDLEGAK